MNPKQYFPAALRRWLRQKREKLSPTARAESARVRAFRAIAEMAARGDVMEVIVRSTRSELVLRDGRRFFFNPADRLERLYSLPVTGEFERKETEWLRQWLQPGAHCVDAGGSFGWYAVLLSRAVGQSGEVQVFEPIPHTRRVLEDNLRLNDCHNVTVHGAALADVEGSMKLFIPEHGVSGSLRLHGGGDRFETFTCPVQTLDQAAALGRWRKVDFIKADIEGAELALLRGGVQTIERDRPMLMLEVQDSSTRLFGHEPIDVFNWLQERGYRATRVSPKGGLEVCSGREVPLPDYNFIFVPAERGVEVGLA